MLLSLSMLIIITCVSANENRYYKYFPHLIPKANTSDFALLPFTEVFDATAVRNKSVVFAQHHLSTKYLGFVVDITNDKVTDVLVRKRFVGFNNDFQGLKVKTDRVFYEQIPPIPENTVFMYKYFGMTQHSGQKRGTKCFVNKNDIPSERSLDAYCKEMPRCLGYIDDVCLVSTSSYHDEFVDFTGDYYEKRRHHKIFILLSDNLALSIGLLALSLIVSVLFPTVLDTVTFRKFITRGNTILYRTLY